MRILGFILDVIVTAVALFFVVNIVPGIDLAQHPSLSAPASFAAVAALFIVVNATLGAILKLLGAPITCLTLGIFALVINAVIFLATEWLANEIGLGLHIDGFWSALFGAAVLGLTTSLLGSVLKR